MTTFRILDLCCGEGGASMGYYKAASKIASASNINIEVVGVDSRPMKRYPFTFIQADALALDYDFLLDFNFIHASPPCKAYTQLYKSSRKDTDKSFLPRLLTTLEAFAIPYAVENVPSAPIRADIQLDGSMFGLGVKRRRIFQTNYPVLMYPQATSYRASNEVVCVAGNRSTLKAASKAMGIDWMSKPALNEAIPPAYTEWIGLQVFPQILDGTLETSLKSRYKIENIRSSAIRPRQLALWSQSK